MVAVALVIVQLQRAFRNNVEKPSQMLSLHCGDSVEKVRVQIWLVS